MRKGSRDWNTNYANYTKKPAEQLLVISYLLKAEFV